MVLHVYIQQPRDDRMPGINAPWGSEFNRHNTWFDAGRTWVDYERRACWLLQQGHRVADVAYFIGDDAPKMTGVRRPELPPGHDFDYINGEVILRRLTVKDGWLTLPDGPSYRVLVLPQLETIRPAVLRKIRDLVKAGATVLGPRPVRSPSLEDYPQCDDEVRTLAAELWGDNTSAAPGAVTFGKGRVLWGRSLEEVFAAERLAPDVEFRGTAKDAFLFTHRRSADADVYFLSNQKDSEQEMDCAFRIAGKQPELWDAVTGERRVLSEWAGQDGQTLVPLVCAPNQSWFVVFRQPGQPAADGPKNFPGVKTIATLGGRWEVSFDPKWGGPERVTFDAHTDWTRRAEDGIKYYSGKATYRIPFELADSALRTSRSALFLDLGEVRDLAVVRVNGKDLGTLWTAPWRVDISSAVQPGENTLEITVINPWNNRLVGDARLPVEQRRTSLSLETVKPNAPLQSAGLLGPITLQTESK